MNDDLAFLDSGRRFISRRHITHLFLTLGLASSFLVVPGLRADDGKEKKRDQPREGGDRERVVEKDKADSPEAKAARRDKAGNADRERPVLREGERERQREGKDREAGPRPQAGKQIRGVFLSREGKSLVVGIGDAARQHLVPFDDKTVFLLNGEKCKLEDLKTGSFLTITQAERLTTRVEARPPRGPARDYPDKKKEREGAR